MVVTDDMISRTVFVPAPGQGRVSGQNLRAAVGGTRMGVHDAARDLHQLADVSHKKDIDKSLANAAINRIAHEVGDEDHRRTV